MQEYNDFLAGHVLNDEEIVTFRKLSRILHVHVNVAKQMLYAFHESSNKIHPASCHATFIVHGWQEPPRQEIGSQLQSSFDSTSTDGNEVKRSQVIALVPEEDLEAIKASFTEIRSIYVYSLEPGRFSDTSVLATVDVPRIDDLPSAVDIYGIISNEDAKRTTSTPSSLFKAMDQPTNRLASNGSMEKGENILETVDPQEVRATRKKSEPMQKENRDVEREDVKPPVDKSTKPTEQARQPAKLETKREPKPKTKKLNSLRPERQPSPMEVDTTPDANSEESMPIRKKKTTAQEAREMEDLKKSMLEDDAMSGVEEEGNSVETPASETGKEQAALQPLEKPKEESQASQEESQPQHRRGRRKVIHKDTSRDEKGYLVTRDEVFWESYSEDEQPAEAKPKTLTKPASLPARKAASAAGKKGQGDQRSIMSFFGKG